MATKPVTPSSSKRFRNLLRLGAWGFGTALALGTAVIVVQTDRGADRLQKVFADVQDPAHPSTAGQLAQKSLALEIETRRLSHQLQALSEDRDRLVERLASLERNFEDVTGSVKANTSARYAQMRTETWLPPIILPPITEVAATPPPANDNKPTPAPTPPIHVADVSPKITQEMAEVPPPPPQAPVRVAALPETKAKEPVKEAALGKPGGKADFAIDLGGASTIEGLRGLWTSTRTAHAPLLDNLQPAAILRPTGKGGAPQLRLMAGPFADASSAASICQAFAQGRDTCRPFVFDGQKLPLK